MADLYGARTGRDILFGPKAPPIALDAEWNEADHPRGQPGNAGQFGPGGGGASSHVSRETSSAHEQSSEPWYAHERWHKAEQEPEPAPMPEPLPAATFHERAGTLGASKITWTTSQKKNAALAAAALNAAGFQAVTENPSGHKTDSRFVAIGSPTNGILVNQRSKFWKDPEAAARHNHDIGHLSTPHPLGVLLHEIAHTQYPDVPSTWMADVQKATASRVSKYGATNPREFVSETFAGLHTGLSYDDDVMRLYQLYTRTGAAPEASPEPMPKLPPAAHTERAKQDHAAIKQMVTKIEETIRRDRPDLHDALIERYPMRLLQHALDTLWETRMQESGSGKGGLLTKADQRLNDVIRGEIHRRVEISHSAREKRADEYAYMSDEEISGRSKLHFSGDSRMKPGLKRQIGLLPPSHIKAIAEMGGAVLATTEIPALSPEHPYAPGMIPAGLYEPQLRRISVGDQVSFPGGGRRMLGSRAHTLRHEIGHAIDDVTVGRMSLDPAFVQAVDAGIERMTDQERDLAGYWIGATASNSTDAWVAKRAETFAEIYAYAYNEGTDDEQERGVAFGGLKDSRLFEIFGPAKKIMREKLDNFFKDEVGFSKSGGANV